MQNEQWTMDNWTQRPASAVESHCHPPQFSFFFCCDTQLVTKEVLLAKYCQVTEQCSKDSHNIQQYKSINSGWDYLQQELNEVNVH